MKKKLKKLRKKRELIRVLKGCFKSSIVYTELKSQTKEEIEFYGFKGIYYFNYIYKRKGNFFYKYGMDSDRKKCLKEKLKTTKNIRVVSKNKKKRWEE